jgi:hypothetical protein
MRQLALHEGIDPTAISAILSGPSPKQVRCGALRQLSSVL